MVGEVGFRLFRVSMVPVFHAFNFLRDAINALIRGIHSALFLSVAKLRRPDVLDKYLQFGLPAKNDRKLLMDRFIEQQSELSEKFKVGAVQKKPSLDKIPEPMRLLVLGKRRDFAELVAPPDRYPLMYRAAPDELAYSIVADGRTLHGLSPAATLPQAVLTDDVADECWSSAINTVRERTQIAFLGACLLFLVVSFLCNGVLNGWFSSPVSYNTTWHAAVDQWSGSEVATTPWLVSAFDATVKAMMLVVNVGLKIVGVVLGVVAAYLSVRFSGKARRELLDEFAKKTLATVEVVAADLRGDGREALQRWKWRMDQRMLAEEARAKAIDHIENFDRSPTIEYGQATGVAAFRGHLEAPLPGVNIKQSVMDMTQHVCVFGATGEGKTRNFLAPVMRQLLALRKSGYPVAMYVTDAKAALWQDLLAEAKEHGLESNVRVIGTSIGQWRVDLLEGISPNLLADVLRGVSTSGDKGDPFFMTGAANLIRDIAFVLQAWEHLPQGQAFREKMKCRPYSIKAIANLIGNQFDAEKVAQDVIDAFSSDKPLPPKFVAFEGNALNAAALALTGSWLTLAKDTKTGIEQNAAQLLCGFLYEDEIANGFADGVKPEDCAGLLSPAELVGNYLTAVNISSERFGMSGRLVNMLLKSYLFHYARQIDQADAGLSKSRLAWWSNPRLDQIKPEHTFTFFLADEYQELVHAGEGGLSDMTVWNVLRSAGIAGVVVSQSVKAYRTVMTTDVVDNFLSNFRSVFCLRVEDEETVNKLISLAGNVMRFTAKSWEQHESSQAQQIENWHVSKPDAINLPASYSLIREEIIANSKKDSATEAQGLDQSNEAIIDCSMVLRRYKTTNLDRGIVWRKVTTTDGGVSFEEFDLELFGRRNKENYRRLSPRGDWDAFYAKFAIREELDDDEMSGRLDSVPVFSSADLSAMGRGRALCFVQRAGVTIVDIVKLN